MCHLNGLTWIPREVCSNIKYKKFRSWAEIESDFQGHSDLRAAERAWAEAKASLPPWAAFWKEELVLVVKPRRIGWQVLPGKGSRLPGSHTCFLRGKSSAPWSFFCTGARASHATHQLSHTPSLAGALCVPGRGTPQLCPLWSGAPRCEVPSIPCRKCRLYSVSAADVKITCKARS